MENFYFNGTYRNDKGYPIAHYYHAKVTRGSLREFYNVDVVIFDKHDGEPFDGYIRLVPMNEYTPKEAASAVVTNPDQF